MTNMHIHRSTIENTLLVSMLAFAPLALGAVHVWSYCTLAIMALALFNLHFLPNIDSFKRVIRAPESIGALLFLAVSLLYITPLPPDVVKLLSPNTWDLWQNYTIDAPKLMTLSVYVHATALYIIKFITYFMVFLVIVSKLTQHPAPSTQHPTQHHSFILLGALCAVLSILFHSLSDFNLHIPANALYFTVMLAIITGLSHSAKRIAHSERNNAITPQRDNEFVDLLVNSLILIAFAIALFGIVQKLSWNGKIYWLIEKAGSNFGPYINYDHYAGYMEMCVFLAVSYFIGKISSSSVVRIKKLKEKIIWLSSREANTTLIYLFLAIVMATALFMTTSRGGIMSFLAALAVFYFVCVICATRRARNRILLASALLVILAIIMFAWVGPEETIGRFQALQAMIKTFIKERAILSEIRPDMWKDTIELIKSAPITGYGLGTYRYIFPMFRTFPERWGFLEFAHNDYLQLLAEMGAVGGVFLAGFLVWYVRKFRGCLGRLRGTEER